MDLEELDLHSVKALREFIILSFSNSPSRRDHILSVSLFCRDIGEAINKQHQCLRVDPDELERLGLLHDIGYLSEVRTYLENHTEYPFVDWHPIDGANYLRSLGEHRLAHLIEGHGNSLEVARSKGLPPFPLAESLEAKIVTFCDSQTGPSGERVTYDERLREITARKGADSTAAKAHHEASPRIRRIISEVNTLLGLT